MSHNPLATWYVSWDGSCFFRASASNHRNVAVLFALNSKHAFCPMLLSTNVNYKGQKCMDSQYRRLGSSISRTFGLVSGGASLFFQDDAGMPHPPDGKNDRSLCGNVQKMERSR